MAKLKTVDIKGKPYVEVNTRIKHFRESGKYVGFAMSTNVIELNDKVCVLQAIITNEKGEITATGMAREVNGDSFINKTSYVENCETSAWGRALGNLGIGIDSSVASKEEVENAIENQKKEGKIDISPHDKVMTQTYLDDAETKLNAVETLEDFEALKTELREDTLKYFQKRKETNAITTLTTMIQATEIRLGGEK